MVTNNEQRVSASVPISSKNITVTPDELFPVASERDAINVTDNFNFDVNTQGQMPFVTKTGDNSITSNQQSVAQQIQQSANKALDKMAADNTIISGTSGASTVQATHNVKAKMAPGFFEGIAGFIGDFAKSEAGTTLLSGLAGQAVGRDFGVSDTVGFLQGASGGQAQIKQQKATAVAADKLKEDQRVQNEKLKIARDANNISRGKAKAVANKPKGKRYPTDMQKSGQTLFQRVNLLSPEEAKIGKNALAKRPEFMALEPWEKSLLTEVMDDKINGGSLAQILATVATARD